MRTEIERLTGQLTQAADALDQLRRDVVAFMPMLELSAVVQARAEDQKTMTAHLERIKTALDTNPAEADR
jgi:hypothetical protein